MAAPNKSDDAWKAKRIAQLEKQIASIEKKIDKNRKNVDPAFMLKELEYAGLHVDLWSAIRQLAHVNGDAVAALKADEAAQGWSTRKGTASRRLEADLLPQILELIEKQERASSSLADLE